MTCGLSSSQVFFFSLVNLYCLFILVTQHGNSDRDIQADSSGSSEVSADVSPEYLATSENPKEPLYARSGPSLFRKVQNDEKCVLDILSAPPEDEECPKPTDQVCLVLCNALH